MTGYNPCTAKKSGSAIIEYILMGLLGTVVIVGALTTLGWSLSNLLGDITKDNQNYLSQQQTQILPVQTSAIQLASNTLQGAGHKAGAGAGTGQAGSVALPDVTTTVQTAGANGTTQILANNMDALAKKALAEGKIDQAQYNALISLANQGHHLAKIEAALEDAGNNSVYAGDDFNNQEVTIEGQTASIAQLSSALGFNIRSDIKLLSNPLEVGVQASPGKDMAAFLDTYGQVLASGALNDPAIKAEIDKLANEISSIADSLAHAAQSRGNSTTITDLTAVTIITLSNRPFSNTTNANSASICHAGAGTDSGTNCSR